LKDIELKLISELIKNSRRSDRTCQGNRHFSAYCFKSKVKARKRRAHRIHCRSNLAKLGFEIIAVTLAKRNCQKHPEYDIQKAKDFAKKNPNAIFGSSGNGLGYDRIGISIHKNYAEYSKFMQESKVYWGDLMSFDSFLISLKSKDVVQPLSLRHFADYMRKEEEPK